MKISEEQFNYIYDTFIQELFNIAYGYTKNSEDSYDIVHNAFVKFLRCERSFKTNDDIKYFLIRLVINQSLDLLKSTYKKKVIINNEILMNIPGEKDSNDLDNIATAVDALPERHKTVIILYYYDLMKIKEIAIALKISESAVKKRLERARTALKEIIERS